MANETTEHETQSRPLCSPSLNILSKFVAAEDSGQRRNPDFPLLPAGCQQDHRSRPQGQEPAEDGHHRPFWSVSDRNNFKQNTHATSLSLSSPDPYVKIYLLYNDQRIAKKKTHVKKRTLNPVFNESFVFDLPHLDDGSQGLQNISLEFMLLDWDRVTKNEVTARLQRFNKWTKISTIFLEVLRS